MASLTGQTVSSTYDGLLKTEDNDILGASGKLITDGLGNSSGLTLSTTGDVSISGDLTVDGAILDSNGYAGDNGQILSSTGAGTDWIDLSEISGVDGSGTANYVPKWTDGDTIGNSVIYDDGANVSVSSNLTVDGGGELRIIDSFPTLYLEDTNAGELAAVRSNNGNLFFYSTDGSTGIIPRMFIDSSGTKISTDNIVEGVNLRLNNTHNGSDWSNGSKVGVIDFYSEDASSEGVKGAIELVQSSNSTTNPSDTDFVFKNYNSVLSEVVRFKGTGDISFRDTSANEAFYWDASTASLGIGTNNPNNNLHIYDAIVNVVATFESGDANAYISFKDSNTAGYDDVFIGAVNQDFVIHTGAGSEKMRIDSSGNVGIGTSSPSAKLDVEGLMLNGSTNPSIMDGGNFRKKLEWNGALNSFGVYNTTNAGVDWQTNLLITSSGNVGIGTDSPQRQFHINSSNTAADVHLTNSTTGTSGTDGASISLSGNNLLINLRENGPMRFETGDIERMRIDSSGRVGIGTSSPNAPLSFGSTIGQKITLYDSVTGDFALGVAANEFRIAAGAGSVISFRSDGYTGAERMRLQPNGDLHVDGDVIAYSTTISDQRLKDDVQTIDNALDKVSNLRGVSYTWNNGKRKGQKDLGLIAQEVEQVLPELVREKEMPMIDGETYKTVDYEKIVGVLIEAVKELKTEIEILKSK